MGAHLSTVQGKVAEEFKQRDAGRKGYLVLKEIMAIKTTYGVEIDHLGVLHKIDQDQDARFTLQELQDFASWAYGQARAQERIMDAGYMVAGVCTLSMYYALLQDREKFLDWAADLFMEGHETAEFEGPDACLHWYVHRKVIKNMHVLLDAERNLGVDYQTLQSMMQDAAEEQRMLDVDNPDHEDWIPVDIVRVFIESITDGITDLMQTFFQDKVELEDVLDGIEAACAVTPAKRHAGGYGTGPFTGDKGSAPAMTPTAAVRGVSSSSEGGSAGRVPQLALHRGCNR